MKYYEVIFSEGENETSSMCIKGKRLPTVDEANKFYAKDVALYGSPITDVYEIDEEYARAAFDFDNESNWKVFE